MRKITIALAAAIALLAGCGSSGHHPAPSPAACKTAMKAQLARGLTDPGYRGTEPAACKGLSAKEIDRLFEQVMSGQ